MVRPMTNWWPMMRIAWRIAARTTGSPMPADEPRDQAARRRRARRRRVDTMRPVSIRPQVEALTNSDRCRRGGSPSRRRAILSRDQPVGGVVVRDAQQRLGQAHQDHALLRGQVVLAQEGVEAGLRGALAAHGLDEPDRRGPYLGLIRGRQPGLVGQTPDDRVLVAEKVRVDAASDLGVEVGRIAIQEARLGPRIRRRSHAGELTWFRRSIRPW